MPACWIRLWLEPCVTRRDSWRGCDAAQEIEFNIININCRVHGESEERSFDAAPTALARAVRARWIFKCTHRLKSCLWARRCAASGFCRETPEPWRGAGFEMIGGPEGPPHLIEKILSGRSAVVGPARRGAAQDGRWEESGRRAIN